MSKGDTGPTGSLIDRVRSESQRPARRWPKVLLALFLLCAFAVVVLYFVGKDRGWGQKLGFSQETSYEAMRRHLDEGNIAYRKGEYREALISFRKAEEILGTVPDPLRMQAQCYLKLKEPSRAIDALERALKIEPHDLACSLDLAGFYFATGNYAVAREICTKAIANNALSSKAQRAARTAYLGLHQIAAQASERLGDLNAAIGFASEYVNAVPGDAGTCLFLARLYQRRFASNGDRNDLRLAEEFLATAENRAQGLHEAERSNPDHLITLAKVLVVRGLHVTRYATVGDEPDAAARQQAKAYYSRALEAVDKVLLGSKVTESHPKEQVMMKAELLGLLDRDTDAIALLKAEHKAEPRREIMAALLETMARSEDRDVLEEAARLAEIAVKDYAHAEITLARVRIQDRLGASDEGARLLEEAAAQAAEAGEDSSYWRTIIADRLRRAGAADESEASFRQALETNPDNLGARLGLLDIVGMRYLASPSAPNLTELEAQLAEATRLNPGEPLVRLWTGVMKSSSGRLSEAREILAGVVGSSPNSVMANLLLGRCEERLGRMDEAIASYRKVIALERQAATAAGSDTPPQLSSCRALLLAYIQSGKTDEAILWGRAAVGFHPENRELRYYFGTALVRKENYAEAQKQFEILVQNHPEWGPARGMLGQCLYRRGLRDKAELEFQEALRLDDRIEVRLIVARFFLSMNDLPRAETEYRNITERFSGDPSAYQLLGHFYSVTGRRELAQSTLRRGISVDPEYLPCYIELADTYVSRGPPSASDLAEARRLCDEVLSRRPDDVGASLILARVLAQQMELAESVESMRKLLDRFPDLIQARMILADTLLRTRDADLAEIRAHLEAVLARFPEHPGALSGMSQVAFREAAVILKSGSDPELANRRLLESLKYDENNTGARIMITDSLFKMSGRDPAKLDEAIREARALVKTQPGNPLGLVILGEILSGKAQRLRRDALAAEAVGDTSAAQELLERIEATNTEAEASIRAGIEKAPEFYVAHQTLGAHLLATDRPAEAQAAFTRAVELAPKDMGAFLGVIESLGAQGKWGEAEAVCRRRLETSGDESGLVSFHYGRCLEMQKSLEAAAKAYALALEHNNRFEIAAERLMATLVALERREEAVKLASKLHEQVPESAYYAFQVGRFHLRSGETQKAREAFESAIEQNPRYVLAYVALQQMYLQERKIEEGIARFTEYLRENELAPIRFILGTLEEQRKNYGLAEAHYTQALLLDPNQYVAANNLAWILAWHKSDAARALPLARKARAGLPRTAAVADTLAWIYILQGEFGTAIDLLDEILKEQEKDVGYQLHRARALEGLGRIDEARTWLARAQDGVAGYPAADERLRREIQETRDRIQ